MPISLTPEDGNIYRVEILGTLRSRDLADCQKTLTSEMDRVGAVRLLVLLNEFEGWEPHDDWRDLSFYVKHGDAVERIAIVGDDEWRARMLMFAGSDLRKAPVEFFGGGAVSAARSWLSR